MTCCKQPGDPGCDDPPDPVNPTAPPEEGIISDLTNTGDVVVNVDNGLDLVTLIDLFNDV